LVEEQEPVQRRPDPGRLAAGVAIIVLGVLLLLDRTGVIDWGTRSGWWPNIALVFGAARLAAGSDGVRSGVFFVAIGAWGLFNEYGVLRYEDSWPLLLVIAGGSMVLGSFGQPGQLRLGRSERRAARAERHRSGAPLMWFFITLAIVMSLQGKLPRRLDRGGRRATQTETGDTVHRSAVLGENRSVSYSSQFHGGELRAIMGDCELDLTHAVVAQGETPVVNVFVLMGDVTLRVPDDWVVDTRAVPALGEVRDSRRGSVNQDGPAAAPPAVTERTHLVIRGVVTMGDLAIKN
jgi:hypothetical protein